MNDVERQSGTRNATILMVIAGAFHVYLGYTSYQFMAMMHMDSLFTVFGSIMMILGLISFCVSLIVWLQKSWATRIIAVVGIVACAAAALLGYYTMIIIIAPLYWFTIKQLKPVGAQPDWHEG